MKPNIILSDMNDSSISDRQVKDCPDVIENYMGDTIYMKAWSLMCLSKNSEEYVKGIIPKSKPTWD